MDALRWLCDAILGRTRGLPAGLTADQALDLATVHGVDALLADAALRWSDDATMTSPAAIAPEAFRQTLRQAVAVEALRTAALKELTDAFSRRRVPSLLIKGAALAFTHYARPFLRPRSDTDLVIARERRDEAEGVLAEIGYVRDAEPDADVASAQRHFTRTRAGLVDAVDLHWRIVNPQAFAGPLDDFGALVSRSVAVPSLGAARTVAPMDALLIACVHRVAHHQDRVHLLWLWDIHLLASAATRQDLEAFAARAADCAMGAVSARSLALARECFDTPVHDDVLSELQGRAAGESSARFIGGGMRLVDIASADLRAAATWSRRLQLAREHLLPGPAYMRSIYPRCPGSMLPLAYVHRIVRGAPKWFRRPAS